MPFFSRSVVPKLYRRRRSSVWSTNPVDFGDAIYCHISLLRNFAQLKMLLYKERCWFSTSIQCRASSCGFEDHFFHLPMRQRHRRSGFARKALHMSRLSLACARANWAFTVPSGTPRMCAASVMLRPSKTRTGREAYRPLISDHQSHRCASRTIRGHHAL